MILTLINCLERFTILIFKIRNYILIDPNKK
jgi:hypothetical protein